LASRVIPIGSDDVAGTRLCVVDAEEEEGIAFLPRRTGTVVWAALLVGWATNAGCCWAVLARQVKSLSFLFSAFISYF
jgi:hypothetical protein